MTTRSGTVQPVRNGLERYNRSGTVQPVWNGLERSGTVWNGLERYNRSGTVQPVWNGGTRRRRRYPMHSALLRRRGNGGNAVCPQAALHRGVGGGGICPPTPHLRTACMRHAADRGALPLQGSVPDTSVRRIAQAVMVAWGESMLKSGSPAVQGPRPAHSLFQTGETLEALLRDAGRRPDGPPLTFQYRLKRVPLEALSAQQSSA